MNKPIEILLLPDAEQFVLTMENTTRKKLFYAIRKTKLRIFGDWFQKITCSDGIFEFRIIDNNKFYRLFAFWDKNDDKETLIVCTHGLVKKSNKTPNQELARAEAIKEKYFKGLT